MPDISLPTPPSTPVAPVSQPVAPAAVAPVSAAVVQTPVSQSPAQSLAEAVAVAAPVERAAVLAIQHPSAPAVEAVASAALVAEAGWSTSEGQLVATVVGVSTTLGGLVASGAVYVPDAAKGWALAGLASAQAVVVGAYAIGRSLRKVGTTA